MSVVFTQADAAQVLADALAVYKQQTGVTLAAADPRRLHLQTVLLLLAQLRAGINYAGNENLLRYVSALNIDELAVLWGEVRLPALASRCTVRFTAAIPAGPITVTDGKRVTNGTNMWAVVDGPYVGTGTVDATVECTVTGAATNGVAIGQIATMVDSIAGVASAVNTTGTISGRDIEATEAFRTRLRSVPESRSTCGPRLAYEALAREASSSVEDALALGPDDALVMAGYPPDPGEVFVLIMEVGEPTPTGGLITTVTNYVTGEEVRPLTDSVTVMAPSFVDYDIDIAYTIARSRVASTVEIRAAVEDAFDAYIEWQRKIGRDINPSELIARIMAAGAKRVEVTEPAFTQLLRDQCSRLGYSTLDYYGVEDD